MSSHLSRRQLIKSGILGLSALSAISVWEANKALKILSQNSASGKAIAELEKQMPPLLRKYKIPGAAIAIVQDSQIVWTRGFGVKSTATKAPVDENTVFAAASLSKPLFAYAALKMSDRGELNLDTPLTAYTEKPYIDDPRINLIAAKHILSHTCGFPNWSGDDPVWIDFTPGSRFQYSSEGFLYLQSVVERLNQQPLSDYMTANLLTPLNMSNSSYVWRNDFETLAASGHDRSGEAQPLRKPTKANAAGSLRTTATDFAKYLIAMMQAEANNSWQLSAATLDKMVKPQINISNALAWGLGWGIEITPDGDFFWHWGDSGIYKSFTLGSRSLKAGIVILTNSANGLKICPEIVQRTIGGKHPAFSFSMIDY